MQDAKVFCSNLIYILKFLVSVLSFLTVARAALLRERRASEVQTKEITIGRTELTSLYIAGALLSLIGLFVTAVILWRGHGHKEK